MNDQPANSGLQAMTTVESFKRAFLESLAYEQGKDTTFATPNDLYLALAGTVRDGLIQRWLATLHSYAEANPKRVYYLSAEYLLGRQLENNLLNTGTTEIARQALAELGLHLEELRGLEVEPGLGNGGLGRLAACYLDSLATLRIPSVGYGIGYEFGIFKQVFNDGWQVEQPDDWLAKGMPWLFPDPDSTVIAGFGGHTEAFTDNQGNYRVRWLPERTVQGVPHNLLVPGYRSETVNTLRLWIARATASFDLQVFNSGDYVRAVAAKTFSENITKVLYPEDSTPQGKQLRLEQQYFFVACSLQDILRVPPAHDRDWDSLPDRFTIHLNDTHPTIAVVELMRLLVDQYEVGWERAWRITTRIFAFTNHTLLPEALERWPVSLFEQLLPRHLELIYEINRRFLDEVRQRFPGDIGRQARLSLIEEGAEKRIRMAHLACVGSYSINGVAALHSELLKEQLFPDFYALWPEKFNNKTNGITPRRFLMVANPGLAELISARIGDEWHSDLDRLRALEALAGDAAFQAEWRKVRQNNKQLLAAVIRQRTGIEVDPQTFFDVMVKRLHEYKRQLLKALHIVNLYQTIKTSPSTTTIRRTVIFGAKAAPGYWMAKLIIKLINAIAEVVNSDPDLQDRLKVVFLPNFDVSLGERIYPAADLSEQLSLAGKEASGTGNMKFALNGALTVGTLDGANIEIRDLVGEDNFFQFGLTTPEVFALKSSGYNPQEHLARTPALRTALDLIASGHFSSGDQQLFRPIIDSLLHDDQYLICADFQSYIDCQERIEQVYQDSARWTRMSILNTARSGFFSSDRAIRQYCEEIWQVQPVIIEDGTPEAASDEMPDEARADLSDDDLRQLWETATLVGHAVMGASENDLPGQLAEASTLAVALGEAGKRFPHNRILRALLSVSSAGATQNRATLDGDSAVLKAHALDACRQTVELLDHKASTREASECKRWIMLVGEKVANAAAEGAFWGLGGTLKSDAEAAVLAEVAAVLQPGSGAAGIVPQQGSA